MKFRSLIFANLFRKKIRLVLTIGSFAVALFLFAFLAVVKGAFSRGADIAGADRLVIINRISIINPLPLSYRDKILRIPGVKVVTHNNWFGGVYQDEKNFFPQFVIDPENQRKVLPELVVPDDQWQHVREGSPGRDCRRQDRRSASAGKSAIAFRSRQPSMGCGSTSTWEFNLDGIYHSDKAGGDETQFWFQWDYFEEERARQSFKGHVGWYVVRSCDNPDDAAAHRQGHRQHVCRIRLTKRRPKPNRPLRQGWVKQFGNITIPDPDDRYGRFLHAACWSPATPWPSPCANEPPNSPSSRPSVSRDRTVLGFILGESLVIALAGGVGLGACAGGHSGLGRALAGLLPPLLVSAKTLAYGVIAALLVGVASGILPGIWRDAHARRECASEGLTW